jgi:hypothetical protein
MQDSLNAWEEYLRQYLPHIRLLGRFLYPADLLKLEALDAGPRSRQAG